MVAEVLSARAPDGGTVGHVREIDAHAHDVLLPRPGSAEKRIDVEEALVGLRLGIVASHECAVLPLRDQAADRKDPRSGRDRRR